LKKIKRWAILLLVFLIVSLTAFTVYMYYIINKSLPQHMGAKLVPGLQSVVDINFDQMDIPQIWAQSENDAWFAVGWLHASDRLFQMDLIRRVAEGRLSEMLGERTLVFDRLQRKIGHLRMAEHELEQLDEQTRSRLQAYVDGINYGAQNLRTLPFEYHLLRCDFEKWTLKDCLSIFSYQTWFSHTLQTTDEFYLELMKKVPAEEVFDFMIPFPDWSYQSVPENSSGSAQNEIRYDIFNFSSYFGECLLNTLQPFTAPFTLAQSSNAWVIAPSKTQNGSAILASDPHLDISMLPEFWYALGIHAEQDSLHVLGLTTPGLPFVVYGRNIQTAWAFTAGGVDITDYFLENINSQNKEQYQSPTGWRNFEVLPEIISIKGHKAADTIEVKIGRHGPVLIEKDSTRQVLCLYWAGFDCSIAQGVKAAFDLARVASFEQFRNLVTHFGALNASWVYADRQGNIGYQLGTPVPIRSPHRQLIQLPGWDDQYTWRGYYPLDQTPHAYNPLRGWLATCNNQPGRAGNTAVPGNFAEDRILRITDLLKTRNNLTAANMTEFQMDVVSPSALRWRAEVVRILKDLKAETQARNVENWQGQMDEESTAACIVETWLFNLKQFTFADEFRELTGVFNNRILFRDYVMEYLYFHGDQRWFDDRSTPGIVETRNDIAKKAMQVTLAQVENKIWGDMQQFSPAHPLAEVPLITQIFGLRRGPFSRGGSPGTLNASTSLRRQNGKFYVIGGPSARLVIELNDIDANTFMLPAGQSGNPVSVHFFDFYERWKKGQTCSVPFRREKNFANAVSNLKLEPLKTTP
jgi:penicillin amidase